MSEPSVVVVVIGRNEAARLPHAIASAQRECPRVVYADSGSRDGSPRIARELGAEVVELDASSPYTAARGRNAGFERALARWPDAELVQFLDGDSALAPGWLAAGAAALAREPGVAAVCGRLREDTPEASIFHRLSELEWDAPEGDTHSFGGIAMIRAEVFRAVGGFRAEMIAGEDPDLATRILARGGRILRLANEMAVHEAALVTWAQWWTRQVRTGYAYAELAARHPGPHGAIWRRRLGSIAVWGAGPVLLALALAVRWPAALLLAPGFWALHWLRIVVSSAHRRSARDAALYAAVCVAAKLPQLEGVLRYGVDRTRGRRGVLMEYKASADAASAEEPE
jgi:GT2 family glycosyltransferase